MINLQLLSQKEIFFLNIEKMNLSELEIFLPNSADYFGASKKEFLKKLKFIFNQITLAGRTDKLEIIKHKKHLNTYYLNYPTHNFSNKFIIIEIEGKIRKIYNSRLKLDKDDINNLHPLEIFFGDDQKINFKPCHCYIKNLSKSIISYNNIVNNEFRFLTVSDISLWLSENAKLYDEVKREYLMFRFNNFKNLYKYLNYLLKEIKNLKHIEKALNSNSSYDLCVIKKWLNDYNELAFCKVYSFDQNFVEIDLSKNIFKSSYYSSIAFVGSEFQIILKFNELYKENLKQIKSTSANSGLAQLGF